MRTVGSNPKAANEVELVTLSHRLAARLREPCVEVDLGEEMFHQLSALLERACAQHGGIGLAANQTAKWITKKPRVAIVSSDQLSLILLNPKIRSLGQASEEAVEGCLSIPGKRFNVRRWRDISVTTRLQGGEELTLTAHGSLARVMQHEIDHLDGKLIDEHPEVQ